MTFRCGLVWFGRASDKCQKEKRKTINGDDLLWAMATLGFEEYVDPLKIYLQKYRDVIMALAHYQYLLQMTIILLFCVIISPRFFSVFLAIFWTGAVIADGGM